MHIITVAELSEERSKVQYSWEEITSGGLG